jgi:hypothetical protein
MMPELRVIVEGPRPWAHASRYSDPAFSSQPQLACLGPFANQSVSSSSLCFLPSNVLNFESVDHGGSPIALHSASLFVVGHSHHAPAVLSQAR